MAVEATTEMEEIAQTVEGDADRDTVTHKYSDTDGAGRDRHSFEYTGVVHAHLIRDEYEVVGIGSSWFAISPRK